jgi:hypothetical protein
MSKELMEAMRMMSSQIQNINKETEMIKGLIEILELKV